MMICRSEPASHQDDDHEEEDDDIINNNSSSIVKEIVSFAKEASVPVDENDYCD